ncbi:MAG: hypothetical protein JSU83_12655 [Deltaproteobacteria bacterium]|nr:MAG: hypothetical protein JSU83_12655 [Deltaproteobacteria bacterium]
MAFGVIDRDRHPDCAEGPEALRSTEPDLTRDPRDRQFKLKQLNDPKTSLANNSQCVYLSTSVIAEKIPTLPASEKAADNPINPEATEFIIKKIRCI